MSLVSTSLDERLARRVLQEEGNKVKAAEAFFERHQPSTLQEAMGLLEAYGSITPQAFEHAATAFEIYWQLRDRAGD